MLLRKLGAIKGFVGGNGRAITPPHFAPYLMSASDFSRLLYRERMRTDRSGAEFALVAFELAEEELEAVGTSRLAVTLKQRLRGTDAAGVLGDGRVGAFLPDTPAAGGWKVADDVVALYPVEGIPPKCQVYAYPTDHGPLPEDFPKARAGAGDELGAQPVELLFAQPLPAWKRVVDVVGAIVGLALSIPVLAATAVAMKLTSPGPVLFRQWRSGLGGVPFIVYKFRTMQVGAEDRQASLRQFSRQDGPAFKMTDDPRVTRLGRFLRTTSIDELPQLWNVLRGNMSLVGPRPLPVDEAAQCSSWQRWRHDVTPGLTCIWQVHGRSEVCFSTWMRMDRQYIRERSLWTDLRILAATIPAILSCRGAT